MKLLHIGKFYAPYRGGMETVLQNLATGLLDRTCQITVVVAGSDGTDRIETLLSPNSPHTGRLVRTGVLSTLHSQPVTPTLLPVLYREISRLQPDLIHLHLPNPLAAAAWLSLQVFPDVRRIPLAIWHHADITRQRLGGRLLRPMIRSCLARATGISVSSETLARQSIELARQQDKIKVIPFGIAPQPWLDLTPRHDGAFLFVGRLVPYKGLGLLIRAVARTPQARLDIVGDGPLAADLRQGIDQMGLQDRVRLVGEVSDQDLQTMLAQARALVLPSIDTSETFGLVQLEAMASAVPVIASDLATGVREVGVHGQTGLLFPTGDANGLAQALETLQQDIGLASELGQRARERFLKNYTRDLMIDRLLAWYQNLSEHRS